MVILYYDRVILSDSRIPRLQKYKTSRIHNIPMRKYLEGRYFSSDKELEIFKEGKNESARKIVKELNDIYPDRRTAKQLQSVFAERTRISLGDVHSKLNLLKDNGLIHELDKKQEGEFRKRIEHGSFPDDIKKDHDPKSAKYVIEDVSNCLHKSMSYQLAPGYFQYTDEFQLIWNSLLKDPHIQNYLKDFKTSILHILINVLNTIRKRSSRIHPRGIIEGNSNYACSNCGIDHESRNFIRAIILHSLDDCEVSNDFINFLWDQKIINENGLERYRIAHQEYVNQLEVISSYAKPQTAEPETKSQTNDGISREKVTDISESNAASRVAHQPEGNDAFLKELAEQWFEKLPPQSKKSIDRMMTSKPEMTMGQIYQMIEAKKQKIGAAYLTDKGALFLVAADLGVSLS